MRPSLSAHERALVYCGFKEVWAKSGPRASGKSTAAMAKAAELKTQGFEVEIVDDLPGEPGSGETYVRIYTRK